METLLTPYIEIIGVAVMAFLFVLLGAAIAIMAGSRAIMVEKPPKKKHKPGPVGPEGEGDIFNTMSVEEDDFSDRRIPTVRDE